MAPLTRSHSGKEKIESLSNSPDDSSSDTKQFPTLYDVMAELKVISSQHAKFTGEISILNNRIDRIDDVVDKLSLTLKELKEGDSTETKLNQGVAYKHSKTEDIEKKHEDNIERSPLTIPGLQSTWNPKRGPFQAPPKSPGPRGKSNLLCLFDPNIDREARKTWALYNSSSEYIQWLWKYWCELIAESELDLSTLDVRDSNKPFRTNLKPLTRTNDVENLMHLQEIQSALVQEGTYYHIWPQRVCHLFQGDFKQVNTFCKTHRPTWPMTIEAILQILALSNQLRSPVDAFVDFRSGPLQNESTAQFLKRFEQAYHRMPTRERNEREVECVIEYTLQTHAGMVWSSLIQQNDAYPLHNALSIAWTVAEKQ